jgi:putative metal-binding protein
MSRLLGLALTLGLGACYVQTTPTNTPAQVCTDIDGDGYCADVDCNDQNSSVHPGADDPPGDGIDQNCDGHDG